MYVDSYMTHSYRHDSFAVTWLTDRDMTHRIDTTHSLWHDSFWVTWLMTHDSPQRQWATRKSKKSRRMSHDSPQTWHIHCDMTHSGWHDAWLTSATSLIITPTRSPSMFSKIRVLTQSLWHDSLTVTWLIHIDMFIETRRMRVMRVSFIEIRHMTCLRSHASCLYKYLYRHDS